MPEISLTRSFFTDTKHVRAARKHCGKTCFKGAGERTFTVIPAGCMSAVGFVYPQLCFATNAIISTFAGTASMLSGITAGAKALGLRTITLWESQATAGLRT